MRYPGGKNGSGTYQRIISQIPPHSLYVEPFAGSAAIARLKRPAEETILIDADPSAIAALGGESSLPANTTILEGDALKWLAVNGPALPYDGFVYCDPPYLPTAIVSRLRYRHVLSVKQHIRLLRLLKRLSCPVMISGYWSELYGDLLADWRASHWPQMTRGGYPIEEWIWMDYPQPEVLHDPRYVGRDYRQRENLARKRRRWTARLARMSPQERQLIMESLREVEATAAATAAVTGAAGGAVRTADSADREQHDE